MENENIINPKEQLEKELRLDCIRMATQITNRTIGSTADADLVIENANKFYDFITNQK